MTEERRLEIRKAIAKKDRATVDLITKEELLEYIMITNTITVSALHNLVSYIWLMHY